MAPRTQRRPEAQIQIKTSGSLGMGFGVVVLVVFEFFGAGGTKRHADGCGREVAKNGAVEFAILKVEFQATFSYSHPIVSDGTEQQKLEKRVS